MSDRAATPLGGLGAYAPVLEPAARHDVRVRTISRRRRRANRSGSVAMALAVVAAAVPLGALVTVLLAKGVPLLGWHLFTDDIPAVTGQSSAACAQISEVFRAKYGIDCAPPTLGLGPAIVGTLLATGLAGVIAIPIGILGAVHVHEVGGRGVFARLVRFFADVMIGVPSIVMGMFVFTVWVVPLGTRGRSAFAAALALACLMLPIVLRSTEEMLRLVPDDLRHANLALGGRRMHGVLRVVLPAALPGIVSGSLLAIARAAGETAPVLFTIGVTLTLETNPMGENTTLAQQIFSGAKSGLPLANQLAWGAAFTLVALVFGLSIVARMIASRFSEPSKG